MRELETTYLFKFNGTVVHVNICARKVLNIHI